MLRLDLVDVLEVDLPLRELDLVCFLNLLVQRYLTQSYYQIIFEPGIKDHKQARNV